MARRRTLLLLILLFAAPALFPGNGFCEDRFPKPEFESSYHIPIAQFPLPRHAVFQALDAAVLLAALALAAFFIFKRRSRTGLYMLALFSVLYFGFYRNGCVCPVGSIQNTFLSLTGSYTVPLVVLFFFTLPLITALFFGRVFCASVCPLGALQELVIFKPVRIPAVLRHVLGLLPFLYLGLALLFTLTGSGFIICQFDPFVGFFRLSGSSGIITFGLLLLGLGLFVARPYCRFLCPYGVLLGIFSFFSKKHLSITPKDCIQCRLCEDACPVDAIHTPAPVHYKTSRQSQIRRLGWFLAASPLIMTGLGFAFSQATDMLARQNRTVALAERIHLEESGKVDEQNLDSEAFRRDATPIRDLYAQAGKIRRQFRIGLWLLGAGFGLVIILKTALLIQRPKRDTYEPDKFHCLSCGRCMEYCPVTPEGQGDNV